MLDPVGVAGRDLEELPLPVLPPLLLGVGPPLPLLATVGAVVVLVLGVVLWVLVVASWLVPLVPEVPPLPE